MLVQASQQTFVLTTGEEDARKMPIGLLIIITAKPPGEDLVLRITPASSLTFEIFQKGRLSREGNGGSCNIGQHFLKMETPYPTVDFYGKSSIHCPHQEPSSGPGLRKWSRVGSCRHQGHRLAPGGEGLGAEAPVHSLRHLANQS